MSTETKRVFTFDWSIDSNQLKSLKNLKAIQSPFYKDEVLQEIKWSLNMSQGLPKSDNIYISLERHDLDEYEKHISISLKLEVVNIDGTAYTISELIHTFPKRASAVYLPILDINFSPYMKNRMARISARDKVMLRCHITHENYGQLPPVVETQMCLFHWRINIPKLPHWSEKIKVPYKENLHFDVVMTESVDKFYIKIEKEDLVESFKLKIRVINDQDVEIDVKDSTYLFESSGLKQRFETFVEKSQVVAQACSTLAYSFSLICAIYAFNDAVTFFGNPLLEDVQSVTTSRLQLQKDLKDLLLSEKHSDIKLRVGDQLIPAHKCVLSARSPVISVMFDQDMSEAQTGIIDIPDVDVETLRAFLQCLYTDTITNTDCEEVLRVMLVADKYQVDALKDQCSKVLMPKLSIDNIYEVVYVADMVNQADLKLFAINFIKGNKKSIISSSDWLKWMEKNMRLANEILSKIII